ncbi:MAG: transposase [Methanogenium sp.]|nr:transposase [Methanogenium sp.]
MTCKAELTGKRVIEISKRKTSKTCCVCGKEHDIPIWKHTMEYDYGMNLNRDRNNAIPVTEYFVDRLSAIC